MPWTVCHNRPMPRRVGRRSFLAGSAAAGLTLAAPWAFAEERPMPLRAFGKTGQKVSLAGLGTAQWGAGGMPVKRAREIVRRAVDLGVNYIDTAPSYGNSHAELCLGLALGDGLREKIFLATKTLARDREGALKELDESLGRLKTDRVDLLQFHALRSAEDVTRLLGEGGALEAGLAAKKAGKVRFLGITGHYDPKVFVDALERHAFDTLLIPLSCIDPHHLSFEEICLPFANRKGTGVVAMKVFCSGRLPADGIVGAEECLRYTYGLPIGTCIVGCTTVEQIELAAHVARNLRPLDDRERATLLAKTKGHSPGLEWYKRKS